MRIRIAAKVDAADRDYFRGLDRAAALQPHVEYVGEIGESDKCDFLGNARALLFPIDWPEPFGLVMIEAMSCGTPCVAWSAGSVPEIIQEGAMAISWIRSTPPPPRCTTRCDWIAAAYGPASSSASRRNA